MRKIGVIGFGGRLGDLIQNVLLELGMDVKIAAVADTDLTAVRGRLRHPGLTADGIRFYTDAREMLDNEELDGCMIGTRCNTHTPYAVEVLRRNIPLFLEKPVSVTMEQLRALDAAGKATAAQTVVSFPLRASLPVRKAKAIIDSGEIGEVQHVQAWNNVPYGAGYYHTWCRDESVTGGLFLQKATHDLDYIQYILGHRPVELCAMESKQIYKGDKPARLRCPDCPEERTCPESEWFMTTYKADHPHGDLCCFSTATGNHDSASVLIRYDTGMHVCYSQNFFARKNAQLRGARFLGYKGTLEFDWYTGELLVHKHDEPVDVCYKLDLTASSHFGGDKQLMLNFCGVMAGTENSESSLEDGIASALLCLKAVESAREHRFAEVRLDG
ncbi:Gfo/Idh/MocA family protein [Anaeromassilibacillus sp. SJQ-5]